MKREKSRSAISASTASQTRWLLRSKTCPTEAIKYGPREELIATAKKRGYPKVYGQTDLDGLGAVYAFKDVPKVYGYSENPEIPCPWYSGIRC
jgi:hypothetical protein